MARHGIDRFKPQTAVTDAVEPSSFSAEYRHAASTGTIDLRVLELLSARLCHELSGPIAAISNGVELLAEEDPGLGSSPNPAFLHDAVALVSERRPTGYQLDVVGTAVMLLAGDVRSAAVTRLLAMLGAEIRERTARRSRRVTLDLGARMGRWASRICAERSRSSSSARAETGKR